MPILFFIRSSKIFSESEIWIYVTTEKSLIDMPPEIIPFNPTIILE